MNITGLKKHKKEMQKYLKSFPKDSLLIFSIKTAILKCSKQIKNIKIKNKKQVKK